MLCRAAVNLYIIQCSKMDSLFIAAVATRRFILASMRNFIVNADAMKQGDCLVLIYFRSSYTVFKGM